jgi:regulatory protein
MQLRTKGVTQDIIAKALSEIDGDSQQQRLQDKLRRKLRTVKAETDFERRGKLFRYGLSQGFDYSDVSEAVEAVMRGGEE